MPIFDTYLVLRGMDIYEKSNNEFTKRKDYFVGRLNVLAALFAKLDKIFSDIHKKSAPETKTLVSACKDGVMCQGSGGQIFGYFAFLAITHIDPDSYMTYNRSTVSTGLDLSEDENFALQNNITSLLNTFAWEKLDINDFDFAIYVNPGLTFEHEQLVILSQFLKKLNFKEGGGGPGAKHWLFTKKFAKIVPREPPQDVDLIFLIEDAYSDVGDIPEIYFYILFGIRLNSAGLPINPSLSSPTSETAPREFPAPPVRAISPPSDFFEDPFFPPAPPVRAIPPPPDFFGGPVLPQPPPPPPPIEPPPPQADLRNVAPSSVPRYTKKSTKRPPPLNSLIDMRARSFKETHTGFTLLAALLNLDKEVQLIDSIALPFVKTVEINLFIIKQFIKQVLKLFMYSAKFLDFYSHKPPQFNLLRKSLLEKTLIARMCATYDLGAILTHHEKSKNWYRFSVLMKAFNIELGLEQLTREFLKKQKDLSARLENIVAILHELNSLQLNNDHNVAVELHERIAKNAEYFFQLYRRDFQIDYSTVQFIAIIKYMQEVCRDDSIKLLPPGEHDHTDKTIYNPYMKYFYNKHKIFISKLQEFSEPKGPAGRPSSDIPRVIGVTSYSDLLPFRFSVTLRISKPL